MREHKEFSMIEKELLRNKGLVWWFWVLLQRLPKAILVKNFFTGEVRVIEKG